MKKLTLTANSGVCEISVGYDILDLPSIAERSRTAIITDSTIIQHYGSKLIGYNILEVGQSEASKSLITIETIYQKLMDLNLDRSALIIGIGGGVVCDLTGFAASTYLRGIEFGFVPTTLLAQVDASVGGKNGINFRGFKNMIGTITQPKFCVCDSIFLQTLAPRELRCGIAEIIKHGAIASSELFAFLESHWTNILSLEPRAIEKVIYESIAIKAEIVGRDERESHDRKKLNFGHTVGHALEALNNIPHGEAISIGMIIAAKLSLARKLISETDLARLTDLIERFGLPTDTKYDPEKVIKIVQKDKKRLGNVINMALLSKIGGSVIAEVSLDELREIIDER